MVNDVDFLTEAYFSTIPHLQRIGVPDQFGNQTFVDRSAIIDIARGNIDLASRFRNGSDDNRLVIFVCESDVYLLDLGRDQCSWRMNDYGRPLVKTGWLMLLDEELPANLKLLPYFAAFRAQNFTASDFVYIDALVSDYRTAAYRKGTGTALIEDVERYAQQHRKRFIYVDCYSGGPRSLVE